MNVKTVSIEIDYLLDQCDDLGLDIAVGDCSPIERQSALKGSNGETILVDHDDSSTGMIDQVLGQLRVDFESLPLLVRGDSKEIRLLTPRVALAKLLPSVYSYTYNRYGIAPGTDRVRARFSAQLFRKMAAEPGPYHLGSAFLGLVNTSQGPLLAEQVVEACNIEVRVKRYHIGSPLHRYRFAERHPSRGGGKPINRWQRFPEPVVCFDWRHPLRDEAGQRLADEPLPDDYAALWMDDLPAAKKLARGAFLWMEQLFERAGLRLVDICFFIDRTGTVLYGEISPDCMRVRDGASSEAEAFDKDLWRSGGSPEAVLAKYRRLYQLVFGNRPFSNHGPFAIQQKELTR